MNNILPPSTLTHGLADGLDLTKWAHFNPHSIKLIRGDFVFRPCVACFCIDFILV